MASLSDLQRAPGAPAPSAPAALPIAVERVRTFDTPEFAGMTFLEVEARSALNRVTGMPFPWSINPYRGCSHACSYCLDGQTPILMADGTTRPLAEIRAGDEVYGTVRSGGRRRYAVTRVLDHWSVVKPAHRVTLADGTRLISSGDHRFLTEHGWRYVAGSPPGGGQRPGLRVGDRLLGTGRFAGPPKPGEDYQLGYQSGMIRGDGRMEDEARRRAREYLRDHGVCHDEDTARVPELIAWPSEPSEEWSKGFLAGSFDAQGDHRDHVLRLTDTEGTLLAPLASCLERFGFRFVREPQGKGRTGVRLRGGLREHLRFFHLTDPAVTRKRTIAGQPIPSGAPTRVVAIEPLGVDVALFDMTTGTGDFVADGVVSHNCFARPTHAYLNLSPLGDFERTVVVKTNVVEVLRRELARPSWVGEHVAMGTNTDPYQRCEGRYGLMPGIIEALAASATPFSILTKGTLITRDLPVLAAAAKRVPVAAALTVGMLDETVWRDAEPGTPSPAARLSAVRRLNDAGIPTGVMLAPIMPDLNDDRAQLAELVDAAARAGAAHITPIVLHLRPKVREVFWPWLTARHPELVDRYAALYRGSTAAAAYREEVEAFVRAERAKAWRRHGRPEVPAQWRGRPGERRSPVTADPARPEVPTGHDVDTSGQNPQTGATGQLSLL